MDDCGVCSNGLTEHEFNIDLDCNGDCAESTPVSCEGDDCGTAVVDDCGVCSDGLTNHEFNIDIDCHGECFGNGVLDECGVCDGDDSSCNAPITSNQNVETSEDIELIIFPVMSDPNNYPLSVQITQGTVHGTVVWQSPAFVYTPHEDYYGTDSLKYIASNFLWSSEEATIFISIDSINDAPVSSDVNITTIEDNSVEFVLPVLDVDSQISISIEELPQYGSIQLESEFAVYSPDENYFGTDSFSFSVDDGEYILVNDVYIIIQPENDIPTSNDIPINTNEDEDFFGSITVNDVDNSLEDLSIILLDQPNLGQLSMNGIDFSFHPNDNVFGMEMVGFKVFDGIALSEEYNFVINVISVNDAPEINQISDQEINEDQEFSHTLEGFDADEDNLEFSAEVDGNATFSLDGSNLIVTPTPDWSGSIIVTTSVTDGSLSDEIEFNILVQPVNDAPIFVTSSLADANEDEFYSQIINISDIDNDLQDLVINLEQHPIWIELVEDELQGIPNNLQIGEETVTLSVTDGLLINTLQFELLVNEVNDIPIALNINSQLNEDDSLDLLLFGTDEETPAGLVFEIVDSPENGLVSFDNRAIETITYTPNTNYFGFDSFSYVVSDGDNTSDTAFVDLIINPVNDAPYFVTSIDDLPLFVEDIVEEVLIYFEDIDNDVENLTFDIVFAPTWISINDNQLVVHPFNNGNEVTNTDISLSISDGELEVIRNFTIQVEPVNDPPISSNISTFVTEDESLTLSLFGVDEDSEFLTFEIFSNPLYGSVQLLNDEIIYTPYVDNDISDSFEYVVFDGELYSEPSLVTVEIIPVNDPPSVNESVEFEVLSENQFQFELSSFFNDIDSPNEDLIVTFLPHGNGDNIVGMTFGSGQIENVLNEDFTYIYNRTPLSLDADYILYKVSDGLAESTLGLITFVLNENRNVNSRGIIQSVPQNIDVTEDTPIELSLVAYNSNPLDIDQNFPSDGVGIIYEIIDFPNHGNLTDFVLTPNEENDGYIVLSGSYSSHSDYGDDIGIDEFREDIFCDDSGLDSLSYSIYNPNTDTWTDTVNISFCVHGVNDLPVFLNIIDKTIDEDEVLGIPLEVNPGYSEGSLDINPVSISVFDPDTSYNYIDFSFNSMENLFTFEISEASDSVYVYPLENYFGTSQIQVSISENYDFDLDGFPDFSDTPDPPLESSTVFDIEVIPVNDPPIVSSIADQLIMEESTITIDLFSFDIDSEGPFTYEISDIDTSLLMYEVTNSQLTLSAQANQVGNTNIQVIVSDGELVSDPENFQVTIQNVNDSPILSAIENPSSILEDSGSIVVDIIPIDNDSLDSLAVILTSSNQLLLPAENISVTPMNALTHASRIITLTPTLNHFGTSDIMVEVTDGTLSTIQQFSIFVESVNDAPVIIPIDSVEMNEDSNFSILLSATDVDNTSLEFSVNDNENFVCLLDNNLLTIVPNNNYFGSDSLDVLVTDEHGAFDQTELIINILPVNDAPELLPIGDIVFNEDSSIEVELFSIDIDSNELSYDVVGGENILASLTGSTLTFTTVADFYGSEEFTITVSDFELTDSETIHVFAESVNDEPLAQSIDVNMSEDNIKTVELLAFDDNSTQFTFEISVSPENGIATIDGSMLTYTPNQDFYGSDVLEYTANDGDLISLPAAVSITIESVNDAPIIVTPDPIVMNENNVQEVEINATDIENDNLNFSVVSTSDNIISWFIGNILSIYPDDNWFGTEILSIAVSDGEFEVVDDFEVTVLAVNDPPSVENQSIETQEEEMVLIPLDITDVDSYTFEYALVQVPSNGTIEFNSGFAQYTPELNFFGQDTIVYNVNDGEFTSNDGAIFIEVTNINDAPVIPDLTGVSINEDSEYLLNINEFDLDGDILEIDVQLDGDDATYEVVEGILTVIPNLNFFGDISITLTVNDAEFSDSQIFTINVLPINDAPIIVSNAPNTIYLGQEYTYQIVINDPDDDSFTFELTNAPIEMEVSETGLLSWLPTSTGIYGPVTLIVSDGGEDNAIPSEEVFSVTVLLYQMFSLHDGANLISYLGIQEDNSIENMLSDILVDSLQILSENQAAYYDADLGWLGSLHEIEPTKGYWLRINNDDLYSVESFSTDLSQIYSLHEGHNLISYISGNGLPLDTALPDDLELHFTDILTEGYAATRDEDGNWLGSLASIGWQQLKGYWVKVDSTFDFNYEQLDLSRISEEKPVFNLSEVPDDFAYTQSVNQSFYFIKDIQLDENEISPEDWVIATCNDNVVGARQWNGAYTDIPAMGHDGNDKTIGYCETGDIPSFHLFQVNSNEFINLENSNTPVWENLENHVIPILTESIDLPDEFSLDKPYPNPFNPITTISYEVPFESQVYINIYDIQGRLVETLVDQNVARGSYQVQWYAQNNSSGLYFVQMRAGNSVKTQKIMLIK